MSDYEAKAEYAMEVAAALSHERDEARAALTRVRAVLAYARKVSPSGRQIVYVADVQAALDGIVGPGPRKTGQNDTTPTSPEGTA